MAGYVLLYFGRSTSVVFIGSLLMMTGYLTGMSIFGAMIRTQIPESKAGQFQGIRIIGQVFIPGIIGPMIGNAVLQNAATVTNNDGTVNQAKDAAQNTILQTLAKSAVANVIKTKEALHFYGQQMKSNENGSRDVRFLYDFANLTVNGVKTKEVRFNVTIVGEGISATKTVVQNTVL